MLKSKGKLNKPSDVEMNTISSSEAKNATNKTAPTVIRETRSGKAKRKAILTVVRNKELKLDRNVGSNVISNVKIEAGSSNETTSARNNKELETIRGNSRVQSTHKATEVWVKALEEFRSNVGYLGKIEEIDSKKDGDEYHASSIWNCMAAIWRHLNQHSVMPKPVEILNPKVYFDLNTIINGKLKNLSAKGLGEPLRGGEHLDLRIDNFVKRFDGEIDIKLYRLKMNQQGLGNYDGQAEVISLPNIKSIIDDYEFYFVKHPVTNMTNFYLSSVLANTVKFNGQWYYGRAFGRKTAVQVLKELGYSDAVQEGLNGFLRALAFVNEEGSLKENEAPKTQPDHTKYPSGDFKQASSIISLASELASEIDNLEVSSTIDVNEPLESATTANEPTGSATTTEPPGSATMTKPPL
ncbi:18212_t:CDS:2 [Cetraspora pellucida]|uniref:18212_t:CDS:1 n=1 Tax=Cetraspora pellucida TaxID=1433469 RepID=A0ACA9NWM3_9GLOM|nr:18212_t:CDS:2 [Cetraspora pellucida]